MAAFRNVCQFNAVSLGAGDFVVGSATAGHDTPQNLYAEDGKAYHYYAESSDGTQWEQGDGVWTLATVTLARTTINSNSLDTTEKIVFTVPPIVSVFPSPPAGLEVPPLTDLIPAGTPMLFIQTAAPVGWTKVTTHNDKALRVVSGTASSGGTNAFSSVMAQTAVGGHTLSVAEMPVHGHGYTDQYPSGTLAPVVGISSAQYEADTNHNKNTSNAGSGSSHDHTITMGVQYVDTIIATRDA